MQLLIVEDERAVAVDLKETLEHLGYGVVAIAQTSSEALTQAETLHPDLVLMDINLANSQMSGIETAQQMRQRFNLPVVFLTAYADRTILDQVTATEPFGYLLKPFRDQDLWVTIETALKRATLERTLHQREAWLASILSGIGDGVIVTDQAVLVTYINAAAERLTGWVAPEAMGQPLQQVFPVVDESTRLSLNHTFSDRLHQDAPPRDGTSLLLTRAGDEVPIVESVTPLKNQYQKITGLVIIFRSILAQRHAQERDRALERAQLLEAQTTELARLNQLKDDFLSTISHELRMPITNINLAIRMLRIGLDQAGLLAENSPTQTSNIKRYLTILSNESEQQATLINNLLNLQDLNAGTYTPGLHSALFLKNWLPSVLEDFREKAVEKQQRLQLTIQPDLPMLKTDPQVLKQILAELLTNACKYTPNQGQITVTVFLEGSPSGVSSIGFNICNSGAGIPLEEQQHIFDSFYRVPETDRWAKRGTGMGLALIKGLTTAIGGRIDVTSTTDQTCFNLYLPVDSTTTKEPYPQ